MILVVCPELPTASAVRRKRRPPPWTTLHLPTRPESTYKSGKVVQTTGATSIHVYCHKGEFRGGDRFARHWHDLTRLDAAGHAAEAIAHKNLANDVAVHKTMFFAEKDKAGAAIDYHQAINGGLQLVPSDEALEALTKDYKGMVDDGLLLDEAVPFEKLLEMCKAIQDRANTLVK